MACMVRKELEQAAAADNGVTPPSLAKFKPQHGPLTEHRIKCDIRKRVVRMFRISTSVFVSRG